MAARRALQRRSIDLNALVAQVQSMLVPVDQKWLADRLRAVWQSTVPAGSLTARVWLAETGRLISHLPFAIAEHSIDEAVRRSARGYTPIAGEILAVARPLLSERRRVHARLLDVVGRGPSGWKVEDLELAAEQYCTPEQARQILHSFGMRSAFDEPTITSEPSEPREPCQPVRA